MLFNQQIIVIRTYLHIPWARRHQLLGKLDQLLAAWGWALEHPFTALQEVAAQQQLNHLFSLILRSLGCWQEWSRDGGVAVVSGMQALLHFLDKADAPQIRPSQRIGSAPPL